MKLGDNKILNKKNWIRYLPYPINKKDWVRYLPAPINESYKALLIIALRSSFPFNPTTR